MKNVLNHRKLYIYIYIYIYIIYILASLYNNTVASVYNNSNQHFIVDSGP